MSAKVADVCVHVAFQQGAPAPVTQISRRIYNIFITDQRWRLELSLDSMCVN